MLYSLILIEGTHVLIWHALTLTFTAIRVTNCSNIRVTEADNFQTHNTIHLLTGQSNQESYDKKTGQPKDTSFIWEKKNLRRNVHKIHISEVRTTTFHG